MAETSLDNAGGAPRGTSGRGPLRPGRRMADLAPRVVSSLVLAAAPLASVVFGGAAFVLIWCSATLAVAYEWQTLIKTLRPRLRFLAVAAAVGAAAYLSARQTYAAACLALLAGGGLAAAAAGPGRRLWAFCGAPYAGSLIVALCLLFFSAGGGAKAVVWLCATVWGTDVFAYFGGRLIGGPKLWPRVSPSKTWSGTLSGIVAGASLGALVGLYGADAPAFATLAPVFLLGLAAAAVSQAGDIFESAVKRRFGVKDSSALIPGHGGFMDRLDGFIAAAAFAAGLAALRGPSGLFHWT
ncbi:phosphatidate cytidylyltransferase [Methylocella sp.]|uniref:phosphatidate cytidylyltransferase n=1 Tax=Methylocella sp. TaxID=1978226 RepID=UPI0037851E64